MSSSSNARVVSLALTAAASLIIVAPALALPIPAERYRASQVSASDVRLRDISRAQLVQADAFQVRPGNGFGAAQARSFQAYGQQSRTSVGGANPGQGFGDAQSQSFQAYGELGHTSVGGPNPG